MNKRLGKAFFFFLFFLIYFLKLRASVVDAFIIEIFITMEHEYNTRKKMLHEPPDTQRKFGVIERDTARDKN